MHEIPMSKIAREFASVVVTIADDFVRPTDGSPLAPWRSHVVSFSDKGLAQAPSASDLRARTAFRGGD